MANKIKIKESKKGTFTQAAKKRGLGVQQFASKVLANKEEYTPAMVKRAGFANSANPNKFPTGGAITAAPRDSASIYAPARTNKMQGQVYNSVEEAARAYALKNPGTGVIHTYPSVSDPNQAVPYRGFTADGKREYAKGFTTAKTMVESYRKNVENQIGVPKFSVGGAALGGAATGATAGSMIMPGIGTAIGAVGGAIIGGVSQLVGDSKKKRTEEEHQRLQLEGQRMAMMRDQKMGQLEPQQQYVPTFRDGGTTGSANPSMDYIQNIKFFDDLLGNKVVRNTNLPVDVKREALQTRKDLLKEIPSSLPEVTSDKNKNQIAYLNQLVDRVRPQLTEENIGTMLSDNTIKNTYNKVQLLRNSGLQRSDLDSLQKYVPEFYDTYNLNLAKPMLKKGTFAMGGMQMQAGMQPNAEIEGGESLLMPNGQGLEAEGPSHAQGGIDMNLPDGTQIYSDQLTVPGSKETFSDANKKLMKNMGKYEKILDNPKSTIIAKKTAKRMLDKLGKEQQGLFQTQQQINHNNIGIPDKSNFATGGYQYTGGYNLGTGPQSQVRSQNVPFLNTGAGQGLTTALSVAPALYNMGQGLFGKEQRLNPADYYNPNEASAMNTMRNRRIDIDPMLEGNRTAAATARYNVRNAARTRGELLGGYAPIAAGHSRADMMTRLQGQQINNQYAGEAAQMSANLGQQRASTRLGIDDMNMRTSAARRNMLGAGLGQIGQYAQIRQQGANMREMDQIRMNLLKHVAPDVADRILSSVYGGTSFQQQ